MYFAFDTETTGIPNYKLNSDHHSQPHLVQLAFITLDAITLDEVKVFNTVIKPNGWVIPKAASDIHGITTEMALDVGTEEKNAIELYIDGLKSCDTMIAHHLSFDIKIMRVALYRYGLTKDYIKALETKNQICTMLWSKEVMKIPPTQKMLNAGYTKYKSPKLSEAYEFFFNEPLLDTHDALADVRGCIKVFEKLVTSYMEIFIDD